MHIDIGFPGGLAVEAQDRGFTIRTDQPPKVGGGGSAPSPFDLFLASIGTCAGLFALLFCRQRELDTSGMALAMHWQRDERGMISVIRLELRLPAGFPDKYRGAILRAIDQCTVKQHVLQPPRFEVTLAGEGAATGGDPAA